MVKPDRLTDLECAVVVQDLTVAYKEKPVLWDIDLKIPKGVLLAIVGPNGAGKTTLLRSIMGMIKPAAGNVAIFGQSIAAKKRSIGYMPQRGTVDWDFPTDALDVVMMGRYGHMNMFRMPKSKDRAKVAAAMERVGIYELRRRQIGELSGGQKKRVFLARALAQESEVVLLDEPFTGIDVNTEEQIMSLLKDMREHGKVILVSTHNLGSVPEFCDRAVLINGTVLASGETHEVFTQDNLQLAFGGVLRRFVLTGKELHDDDDRRQVTVLSDDERPVVLYGEAEVDKFFPCPTPVKWIKSNSADS